MNSRDGGVVYLVDGSGVDSFGVEATFSLTPNFSFSWVMRNADDVLEPFQGFLD